MLSLLGALQDCTLEPMPAGLRGCRALPLVMSYLRDRKARSRKEWLRVVLSLIGDGSPHARWLGATALRTEQRNDMPDASVQDALESAYRMERFGTVAETLLDALDPRSETGQQVRLEWMGQQIERMPMLEDREPVLQRLAAHLTAMSAAGKCGDLRYKRALTALALTWSAGGKTKPLSTVLESTGGCRQGQAMDLLRRWRGMGGLEAAVGHARTRFWLRQVYDSLPATSKLASARPLPERIVQRFVQLILQRAFSPAAQARIAGNLWISSSSARARREITDARRSAVKAFREARPQCRVHVMTLPDGSLGRTDLSCERWPEAASADGAGSWREGLDKILRDAEDDPVP